MKITVKMRMNSNSGSSYRRRKYGARCRQALRGELQQRGVSVYDVDIFLESSYTPLPLNSDCYPLASSVLHVHCKIHSHFSPIHSSGKLN